MMAGTLVVYRGEEETRNEPVLVEFNDMDKAGGVEIGFKIGKDEAMLRFNLPQLLAHIAEQNGSE